MYSALNGLAAIVLIAALYQIKQKNIAAHQRLMNVAVVLSGLFLVGYVIYHLTNPDTLFGDINHDGVVDEAELLQVGGVRTIYLIILISHIVLAAVILPFILFTYIPPCMLLSVVSRIMFENTRKWGKLRSTPQNLSRCEI